MVPTYRQGLQVLFACVLALGLGGCTFDEDELHGLPEAGVEVAAYTADAAADGRPDGGGIDSGPLDASRIDAGRIDTAEDVPMPGAIDGGTLDGQRIDAAGDDANDAPLGGLDVALDAPSIGVFPVDAAAVDGPVVDLARAEAAPRDGTGRDG